jgi:hypothetical protein
MPQRASYRSIAFSAFVLAGLVTVPVLRSQDTSSPSIAGTYAFRMSPAKSFSADAPNDPGGVAGAPRQDILRVGVVSADGAGNLSGHTIATTDTNKGQTWLVTFDWTGKYIVNSNGTGYFSVDTLTNMVCTDMTVTPTGPTPHPASATGTPLAGNVACPTGDAAVEGPESYAFVLSTPGGKHLDFIETDNAGGGAKIFMTGGANHIADLGQSGDQNPGQSGGNSQVNGNGNGHH